MPTSTPSIIVLPRLEGNSVPTLSPLQAFSQPYTPIIASLYWILWLGILYYLISVYIVKPLLAKRKK